MTRRNRPRNTLHYRARIRDHFPTFRFARPPSRLKYLLQIQLWHLRIAVHNLADPGSLVDCVSLACDAAIRHFHYPDVAVLSAREMVAHEPVTLALDHTPFCISLTWP
jgi:exosome complex RNA-binding protein Rrp42 (RNase PH superfamily)